MKKLCILALSLIVLLSSFGLAAFAETTTTDVATVKSLDEFNAAIGDENINTIILGDNIILTYRYEVANFNKADRHITIDGQNLYGFVGNNENWRTDTYKHLYNINKGNITFKDLTFDCNNQGQGVNVYQAKNVTLDNVKIINVNTRAFTSLTVNRSIVSVINGIYIRGVAQAIDVDKNDNGLALNLSGVIDVDNKTIRWSAGSPAESDVSGALQTDA